MLAERCLNIKGEDRPSMKEVAAELEAASRLKQHSWLQTDQNSEEIESLLQGTEGMGFGYNYNEHNSIHIDSIMSHITLPAPGGR